MNTVERPMCRLNGSNCLLLSRAPLEGEESVLFFFVRNEYFSIVSITVREKRYL